MKSMARKLVVAFALLAAGAALLSKNRNVRTFVESLNGSREEVALNLCTWARDAKRFDADGMFRGRGVYTPPLSSRASWIDVACHEGSKEIMVVVTGPEDGEKNPSTLAGSIPVLN